MRFVSCRCDSAPMLGGGGLHFRKGESTITVAPFIGVPGNAAAKVVTWSVAVGKKIAVMSHLQAMVLVVLASALTLAASAVRADVFNMPNGQTSLRLSPWAIRATRRIEV